MTKTMTERYVGTMKGLLAAATALIEQSEIDIDARNTLAEKLETALDLVCLQGHSLHRPQIDALAPPMLDT